MGLTSFETGLLMRGAWYFGPDPVRLEPHEIIYLRSTWGAVAALLRVLGGDYLAEQGYLEEVWDAETEALGLADPWPVVDIRDDGQVVARRVAVGYFSRSESQRFQPV